MEWLNDNSGAVQAIAVVVLVVVTSLYWWAARQQAKASVKMAKEMREQRMDAARPVLVAKHQVTGNVGEPPTVELEPCNIGLGPALNVQCAFDDPIFAYYEEWWSAIGPNQSEFRMRLRRCAGEDRELEEQREPSRLDIEAAISIKYADVYGRLFETLIKLKQEHIGWTDIRTDVRLIDTVDRRARPTASWVEFQLRNGQEEGST